MHLLPHEIDEGIAFRKLEALGLEIDRLTDEQQRFRTLLGGVLVTVYVADAVVTCDAGGRVFRPGAVTVEDGRITAVGPAADGEHGSKACCCRASSTATATRRCRSSAARPRTCR